jgi:hypothetical protein
LRVAASQATVSRMQTKQARTALALALVAASTAAVGSLAGPVSSASATTWSRTHTYLHFPPWRPTGRFCLTPRVLRLNGTYQWRAYTSHWAHPRDPFWNGRRVRLRGRYAWFVCRQHLRRGYRIDTALNNQVGGGGQVELAHHQFGGVYGDGSYDWGSTLDRVGPFRR